MFRKISYINCEIWGGVLIRTGALITVNTVHPFIIYLILLGGSGDSGQRSANLEASGEDILGKYKITPTKQEDPNGKLLVV